MSYKEARELFTLTGNMRSKLLHIGIDYLHTHITCFQNTANLMMSGKYP